MNSGRLTESISSYTKSSSSFCEAPERAESVLRDVIQLLEEYGPVWYTEELRDRAALVIEGLR